MEGATVIIPARGGSKGLANKNLASVGGISLIGRAVAASRHSQLVSRVIVTTDSAAIAAEAEKFGASISVRPSELAQDHSLSEPALQHAIEDQSVNSEIIAFVECTSPFISHEDLDRGIQMVAGGMYDSLFSAAESYETWWQDNGAGPVAVAHDPSNQTRRQDRVPFLKETGAFYVFGRSGFLRHRNRFFGRIGCVLVDPMHGIEIDTAHELAIARHLAESLDQELGYFN